MNSVVHCRSFSLSAHTAGRRLRGIGCSLLGCSLLPMGAGLAHRCWRIENSEHALKRKVNGKVKRWLEAKDANVLVSVEGGVVW